MKDARKKALRKFRKRSILVPVLLFFAGVTIVFVFGGLLVYIQVDTVRKAAMKRSRDVACYEANMFDKNLDRYDGDIEKAIEDSDSGIIVISDGKLIHGNADVKLKPNSPKCEILDGYYVLITDAELKDFNKRTGFNLVADPEDGEIGFGTLAIIFEELMDKSVIGNDDMFFFNAWFPTGVECDGGEIYVYTPIEIASVDLSTSFILVFLCILTGIIVSLALFLNIIMSVIRNNRMLNALYFDSKTLDHNWLYLTTKSEKVLQNRTGLFTVLSIHCRKYDHVKSCIGAASADDLLNEIFKDAKKYLGKKDVIARFDDENIGVVFRRDSADAIANVVNGIANELGDRVYTGGYVFEKKKRSKKLGGIGIEDFYHYAELARKTLDESSPFRVAYFDDKMKEEYIWIGKVEAKLDAALANEELAIYIQPKYDPKDSSLKGAEALVKWISPDEGVIQPGKFIPVCEENGTIVKIDDYMISHISKLQSSWLQRGFHVVPISVNVSRAHFMDPDLAEHICALVDEYNTPHKYIEIELTESVFFDDKRVMLSTVSKLQNMGFLVSMDDFGSGYSSLNSLKDLSLNILKLDAGFFRGEGIDQRGELIVSKAIELAKALNMEIVAEGVEKKDQVDFLANAGCDLIQGYYFDKPITALEFEQRMNSSFAPAGHEAETSAPEVPVEATEQVAEAPAAEENAAPAVEENVAPAVDENAAPAVEENVAPAVDPDNKNEDSSST